MDPEPRSVKCAIAHNCQSETDLMTLGPRVYAARLWLACAKAAPHMVDLSKLDALRAVAYGGGS